MDIVFSASILVVLILGFGLIFWLITRKKAGDSEAVSADKSAFIMLQNQINDLNRSIESRLHESNRAFREQFSESAKLIKEITQELTKVGEGQKQVMDVTDQLKNLQDILKNPKQRGVLGEYYLEALLKNVLAPNAYQMQYVFADGNIVDAIVFIKDKKIPIDSKFSLENYNRLAEAKDPSEKDRLEKLFVNDLKNRIVETSKYIRPEEGTTDFAFMFIPHEAIYYDLLVNKVGAVTAETENLIQRAAGKYHVIIVSPTSFLAYLQTVLQGLKAMQIEESAKEIIKKVGDLSKHLETYEGYMQKVGTHLGTTVNAYNSAYKELKKVDKDIAKISGASLGIEPALVSLPEKETIS